MNQNEYIENLVANMKESFAALERLTAICYFRRQVRRWRGKTYVYFG